MQVMSELEQHFRPFAEATVGNKALIDTPYGQSPLVYADWAASGRLFKTIEDKMLHEFGPLVANTHTESNACGEFMTDAYHEAQYIIKEHVGAAKTDALLTAGSGMTSAVVLLQRLLGWRIPEQFQEQITIPVQDKPVVFVSSMEHHSNHTTWLETIADVVVIPSDPQNPIDLAELENQLASYEDRRLKVAAVTAASNVTGARLPIHEVAKIMHHNKGLCFVDYTCAAPYDEINMHPTDPDKKLDAIYFSPHKFLGGPGTPGILVFDSAIYPNTVPDRPGGGTVLWTNPWGGRRYFTDIEVREDGGTPPFLGLIKAALAVKLKDKMGTANIAEREEELVEQVFNDLSGAPGIDILDENRKNRLAVFALSMSGLHYNQVTRLLNDRFGIQARGGCACAGTYGHFLFDILPATSKDITDEIDKGDLSHKPGFVRVSLHPTMPRSMVSFVTAALQTTAHFGKEWSKDYDYDPRSNEFFHSRHRKNTSLISSVFEI